jgi:hypothetical protein
VTVFVVMTGEFAEGGSIVAVCSTMESAHAAAAGFMAKKRYPTKKDWTPSSTTTYTWTQGCDWLAIERKDVTP